MRIAIVSAFLTSLSAATNLQRPLQQSTGCTGSSSRCNLSKEQSMIEAPRESHKHLLHRPYTAEEIFFHKHVLKLRRQNPGISNAELGRKLGAHWYGKNEVRDTYDSAYHLGEGLTYASPAYALEREWHRRRIEHSAKVQNAWTEPTPMPQWHCDDGTFDDAIRAPEIPQNAREWYKRSLMCEAIKEKRTGRESWSGTIEMKAQHEWPEMSDTEKEPFELKSRLQKEGYLHAWELYSEAAADAEVAPWIMPCSPPGPDRRRESELFQRAFGSHMQPPPDYPQGFRSAYMIYYREKICDAVIEEPGKEVDEAEHGRAIDSIWNGPSQDEGFHKKISTEDDGLEERIRLHELYESKFQAAKAEFLADWTEYWVTALRHLTDPDHKLEHEDLWRLKIAHAFGSQALFHWDREYKWHAEDRISGMNPAFLTKSDEEWNLITTKPGNLQKHYEDLEREIKDAYEKATGMAWGDPHQEWAGSMRKTEL